MPAGWRCIALRSVLTFTLLAWPERKEPLRMPDRAERTPSSAGRRLLERDPQLVARRRPGRALRPLEARRATIRNPLRATAVRHWRATACAGEGVTRAGRMPHRRGAPLTDGRAPQPNAAGWRLRRGASAATRHPAGTRDSEEHERRRQQAEGRRQLDRRDRAHADQDEEAVDVQGPDA